MARRYDNVEPEVPPEEDGLDHLGKSLTAEQIKHEEELARLAVLEREALEAAAIVSPEKFLIPRGRYEEPSVSPHSSAKAAQPHRYGAQVHAAAARSSEPTRGAGHSDRRSSAVGDGAGPHLAARHAAGPKRFIPSVTAAEEDRIIRENAGIAHRLENILAKPAGARPRGVSEGVPFDRELARDRVRRLKEKELERENWNLYKRLEGVRPTIKIGAVPTVPKRAIQSANAERPSAPRPRPEWQD